MRGWGAGRVQPRSQADVSPRTVSSGMWSRCIFFSLKREPLALCQLTMGLSCNNVFQCHHDLFFFP